MVNPYSNPFYLFTPIIASTISFILAFLVIYRDSRATINRLHGLTLLCVAMWALFIYFMRSSSGIERAYYFESVVIPFGFAITVFYYHFTLVYTRRRNSKILWGAYLYLILAIILSIAGLLVEGVTKESSGYAPQISLIAYPFSIFAFFLMMMGLRNLIIARRAATGYKDRVRFTYLIIAILFPFILSIPDFFPSLPPVSIFGNLLFGFTTAWAIIRYNLLGVEIVVRKSAAYVLTSAVIAIPYVGIVYLAYVLFGDTIPIWGHIVIAIILAILLQAIWQRTQHVINRLFYRERYDSFKAIEEIGWQMSSVIESESLSLAVVNTISRILHVSIVYLLMPLHQEEALGIAASTDMHKIPNQFMLSKNNPLVQFMENNSGVVRRRDFDITMKLQLIVEREREIIDLIEGELYVPVLVRGKVIGMIVLGKKLSGQHYSIEDERLLLSISNRLAVQLENASLYVREKEVNQKLLEQSELKNEFLLAVAHELRTPLTAILSSSEIISSQIEYPSGSMERRLADNINRSALSINRRVQELLDSARVQIGTLEVNPKNIDFAPVVKEVVNILMVLFNEKNQSITVDLSSSLPRVIADRDRIEQVMINLLSNANKFSPRDSGITVRVFEADSMVVLEVEDSAEPITEKEGAKLFEPYYRGEDPDKRRRIPGLGLGLVVCRRLIELHNGKIWFERRDGSKGNIFAFSIPIAKKSSEEKIV